MNKCEECENEFAKYKCEECKMYICNECVNKHKDECSYSLEYIKKIYK